MVLFMQSEKIFKQGRRFITWSAVLEMIPIINILPFHIGAMIVLRIYAAIKKKEKTFLVNKLSGNKIKSSIGKRLVNAGINTVQPEIGAARTALRGLNSLKSIRR